MLVWRPPSFCFWNHSYATGPATRAVLVIGDLVGGLVGYNF